jgi:hypothetical protein
LHEAINHGNHMRHIKSHGYNRCALEPVLKHRSQSVLRVFGVILRVRRVWLK